MVISTANFLISLDLIASKLDAEQHSCTTGAAVRVDVIQVARRETTTDLVARATVRFLQDSANSGDRIGIEVLLLAAEARDLNLVVTLAPGTGDNPAVPGVDYVDEPVPVVIRAGTSRAIVNVQLPLNADLSESRSLSVTVSLAS